MGVRFNQLWSTRQWHEIYRSLINCTRAFYSFCTEKKLEKILSDNFVFCAVEHLQLLWTDRLLNKNIFIHNFFFSDQLDLQMPGEKMKLWLWSEVRLTYSEQAPSISASFPTVAPNCFVLITSLEMLLLSNLIFFEPKVRCILLWKSMDGYLRSYVFDTNLTGLNETVHLDVLWTFSLSRVFT